MKKVVFLFFIISGLLIHCEEDAKEAPLKADINQDYPDQETWNATSSLTRAGKKIGIIKAGIIKKYRKKSVTLLSDSIRVDFFDKEGHHTSVLTSLGGEVLDVKQDMVAYGNVVVVSDSGITLRTDTLYWDNKRQKVISKIPVIFTTLTDTLFGDSFESDPDLTNYQITNPRGKSGKKLGIE
jgi:LPS export ABC transporter protein LptC